MRRSIDKRLSKRLIVEDRNRQALIEKYPQESVEAACRRHHWVMRWRKECEAGGRTNDEAAARIVNEAREVEDPEFKISVTSLYRWHASFQRSGLEGLVDQYCGPHKAQREPSRSSEAIEYFYESYHCKSKLSVRTCHEITLREAKRRGWQ